MYSQFDMEKIITAKEPLPNVKEIKSSDEVITAILYAHGYPYKPLEVYYVGFSGTSWGKNIRLWHPKIFTNVGGMYSLFDGTGVVVSSLGNFTFEMCEHDWDTIGSIPHRGYHKKICKKCRFNATIDSGD